MEKQRLQIESTVLTATSCNLRPNLHKNNHFWLNSAERNGFYGRCERHRWHRAPFTKEKRRMWQQKQMTSERRLPWWLSVMLLPFNIHIILLAEKISQTHAYDPPNCHSQAKTWWSEVRFYILLYCSLNCLPKNIWLFWSTKAQSQKHGRSLLGISLGNVMNPAK